MGLAPAMSVTRELVLVKDVPAGQGVSYGHEYVTRIPTTLGLVSAGYADGIFRSARQRRRGLDSRAPLPHRGPRVHGPVRRRPRARHRVRGGRRGDAHRTRTGPRRATGPTPWAPSTTRSSAGLGACAQRPTRDGSHCHARRRCHASLWRATLLRPWFARATCVILTGDLGAGKTTLHAGHRRGAWRARTDREPHVHHRAHAPEPRRRPRADPRGRVPAWVARRARRPRPRRDLTTP